MYGKIPRVYVAKMHRRRLQNVRVEYTYICKQKQSSNQSTIHARNIFCSALRCVCTRPENFPTFKYRVKLSFLLFFPFANQVAHINLTPTPIGHMKRFSFASRAFNISRKSTILLHTSARYTFLFPGIRASEQTAIIKYNLNRSRSYSRNIVSISVHV